MPSLRTDTLSLGTLALVVVSWGCSPDESPTGPSTALQPSITTAATYTIRDLGTLGGPFASAYGINNAGVVVGSSSLGEYPDTRVHAFVWKNGVMKDLGTIVGGSESHANAINNDGFIVGYSLNGTGDTRAVRWTPDGRKRSLGTLGGRNSEARGINDFGVIVGWSETLSGQRHAFRWENGVMTDLGTMGGTSSEAYDINRGGAVVGASRIASGKLHAFKWKAGVFKDLGVTTAGGGWEAKYSVATAINTKGQIAGITGPPLDAEGEEVDITRGFVFYQDRLTGCCRIFRPTTEVNDINTNGIVVGMEWDGRSPEVNYQVAWVHEGGTTTQLPGLSDEPSEALGINLAGNIVGYSRLGPFGPTHAVLWRRQ